MAQMYSYNGVELPPLPEWDKETYPYAVIRTYADGITITAIFFQSPLIEYQSSNDSCYVIYPADTATSYCACKLDGDTWSDVTVSTVDRTGMSRWRITIYTVFWSNFDIPNEDDGTTYLAASDPVFVYNAADFWSGVACGLSGSGVPDFEETTCFGKGYLAGAQLRLHRPAGGA